MRQNNQTSSERIVKDIKCNTRKQSSAEGKIRIVLDGLRGEESIADNVPPERYFPRPL